MAHKKFFWNGLLLAMLLVALPARADTVKLKDGTVLQGTIIAEDENKVTIEVAFAGGSIVQKKVVSRADIASIVQPSAAEKAAAAMQKTYAVLQKLQLDPATNFAVAFYDDVIGNQFRKFLTQYPDSPHSKEVTDKITEWQAERDKVAAGNSKVRGQWYTAVERAQGALTDGKLQLQQGRFDAAFQRLKEASAATDSVFIIEVNRAQADLGTQWLDALEKQQKQINADLETAQQRFAAAKQAKATADPVKQPAEALKIQTEYVAASKQVEELTRQKEITDRRVIAVQGYKTTAQTDLQVNQAKLVVQEQQAQLTVAIAKREPILAPVVPLKAKVVEKPVLPVDELPAPKPVAVVKPPPNRGWFRENWLLIVIVLCSALITSVVFAAVESKREKRYKE